VFHSTRPEDLPALVQLWNDGRVMHWVGFPAGLGYDLEKATRWLERLNANPHRRHFIARTRQAWFCGELYYAVDPEHRRAGLDIKFRPEAQGGRRAFAALGGLIRYVFEHEPEVDAVWTEPSPLNLAARTVYWGCGMHETDRPADMEPDQPYWELTRSAWQVQAAAAVEHEARFVAAGPPATEGADQRDLGVPPGLALRFERPEDHAAVDEVNRLAFGRPAETALVAALRPRPDCISLVACLEGDVVGHAFFTPVRIKGPSAHVVAAGLGPMAVRPDRQRQGIGSRLVRAGLQECRRAGYEAVVVLGHAAYYPRFGFRRSAEFGLRYETLVPEEAFMALELRPGCLRDGGGIVSYLPEFGSAS
jgi:putative acetyltransferase